MAAGAAAAGGLEPFDFATENGLPKGWKPLAFRKIPHQTTYTLEQEDGNWFVKAVSSASASGLLREMRVDLMKTPVLAWRWKVEHVLKKADARTKAGDDYAARIYVAFRYDPEKASLWQRAKYATARALYGAYPPGAAINYIWDNKLPAGTVVDNPYTDRVKMVAVESGDEKAGGWVSESRNVLRDYQMTFGGDPPPVAFVAVMTDTDNTGESAVAYYDDLSFQAP